ncbi:alpha/beta hydrolase [Streptomyces sp. NBC_00237]|uniref:alpha/beta fold hydrolase n=1 Tax=Streptomyces sp. NBC_00237 TaxID=2975687 RepID=UPI00225A0634|nr:alpha/beta hydrolase [Streptomyces sp. NBC_00237]MCX5204047.1 alpha/beta hydrolase [Streptomyces sp. NBC_00237]
MSKVISRDGTPLAYERKGEGAPLILVGGAFSTGTAEDPLANLLAPGFSVVTYDRRGRGGSGDTVPYAVAREVEDLAALIEEVGGSACLYGMSSGGALVLRAAAAGLSVPRIAVYEPPFTVLADTRAEKAAYTERLKTLLDEERRGEAVELFLSVVGMPREFVAQMKRAPVWRSFESLAPTLAYDDAVMGDGTVPVERLSALTQPVLVVSGDASPGVMRDAARRTTEAVPDGRHVSLPRQTHDVDPRKLAPVLEEFFTAA